MTEEITENKCKYCGNPLRLKGYIDGVKICQCTICKEIEITENW